MRGDDDALGVRKEATVWTVTAGARVRLVVGRKPTTTEVDKSLVEGWRHVATRRQCYFGVLLTLSYRLQSNVVSLLGIDLSGLNTR